MYMVMYMFFVSKDNIPEGVGFGTFSLPHIIWLVAIVAACILAAYFYKRLDDKKRKTMCIVVGATIVSLEIIKDIYHGILGEFGVGYLPLHLCGINILLIAFDLFYQNKTVRNFLYYFAIAGASLALLFPNWTQLPLWNFSCLHSFIIHALLVMYPIMLVAGGDVKPDIKTMPKCVGLLAALAVPIYFVNLKFGTNFMFLMSPDKGNPLEMFEKLLGNHLWGFPILLPIVMFVMYLPIFIVNKCKEKRLG